MPSIELENPADFANSGLALEDGGNLALIRAALVSTLTVNVTDRAARLLGVIASITAPVDVSDRAGRLLGVVASIAAAVDVSDRAGRLLGIVSGQIADQGQATTAAAAAQTPTLAALAGATNYVTGFSVDGLGATAAAVIEVTLAGVIGGTKRYKLSVPAGAAVAVVRPLIVEFATPIAATAANVAIVLTVPTFGAGNTSAVAAIHGFRR
jgi:hypothetical protein